MDAAKIKSWRRFFERVVSSSEWPRRMWLAAVEDALAAALGPDSRLVADYRADVAELLGLEQTARGTYHDEQRIAALEGRIKHLPGARRGGRLRRLVPTDVPTPRRERAGLLVDREPRVVPGRGRARVVEHGLSASIELVAARTSCATEWRRSRKVTCGSPARSRAWLKA